MRTGMGMEQAWSWKGSNWVTSDTSTVRPPPDLLPLSDFHPILKQKQTQYRTKHRPISRRKLGSWCALFPLRLQLGGSL